MNRFSIVVMIAAFTSASCQNSIFMAGNNLGGCRTWTSAVEKQAKVVGNHQGIRGAWPYSGAIIPVLAYASNKNEILDAEFSEDDIATFSVIGGLLHYGLGFIYPVKKAKQKLESNWRSQHEACSHTMESLR